MTDALQYSNNRCKDNIWPVTWESIFVPEDYPTLYDKDEGKRRKKRYRRLICCPCVICRTLLLLCMGLLLAAALAALILCFIFLKKQSKPAPIISVNRTTTTAATIPGDVFTPPIDVTNSSIFSNVSDNITTNTIMNSTVSAPFYCGTSCINQSWIDTSGVIARWPFDGSYADVNNIYNGSPSANLPTFVTGYRGQAAFFNASLKEAIFTPFIQLHEVSFTIEAWINPVAFPNPSDESIVGLCPSQVADYCLHVNIRRRKLYFGFYYNDVQGKTTIQANQWIHTAFVFNVESKTLTIYINGFMDEEAIVTSPLLLSSGNFTIGTNEGVALPNNFFQGYIDELAVNRRPKSACEILELATLAAHFKFDDPQPMADSSPYLVTTISSSTSSIINGRLNQGISFSGSSSSYFQASGLTSLGFTNQPFSISFWIQPKILSGTLVHLSSTSTGTGTNCFPLLGFSSTGAIIAQVLIGPTTLITAPGPILPVSSSTWLPVVQTWSSANGIRLYVNNTLVSSISASAFLASGTTPNYLTLGGCLNGCGVCPSGEISAPGPFAGGLDDFRVYLRELTAVDVCALAALT